MRDHFYECGEPPSKTLEPLAISKDVRSWQLCDTL